MTTYSIDSLPIPVKTAGTSPLGAREGTVTPPEPPTPPTPALTYFSGKSESYEDTGYGQYAYWYDPSTFEHADKFVEKQIGDPVSVTIDGTPHAWAVDYREEDSGWYDLVIADPQDQQQGKPCIDIQFTDGAASNVEYYDAQEIPGGITLTIADA